MSCCDGMTINIKNQATDSNGSGLTAEVVGVSGLGNSTLRDINPEEKVSYNTTITGDAFSGFDTAGQTYGNIQLTLPWEGSNETVTCSYHGNPFNGMGWCPCTASGSSQDSDHFQVFVSTNSGDNGGAAANFLIQTK